MTYTMSREGITENLKLSLRTPFLIPSRSLGSFGARLGVEKGFPQF